MNFAEIKKMRFLDSKDLVFEVSDRGYITQAKENMLSYNTFFSNPEINVLLNVTASVILIRIDGKRTLENVFKETFDMFENVTPEQYICDFMDVINHLERSGIIYSTTEKKRHIRIRKTTRKALLNNLMALNG
ncbi:MAG: hypothetical protein FWE10_04005 [Rikenellaceae bacterium]|nr:hypothetical protein [Rikenellaceae bacterium]MCL2692891.1 hypothetical protein [Rikenellaceae bacterium]